MCSFGFARSMGFALMPLATCCIVANILLFFPGAALNYVSDGHISMYPWLFMGVGGGGLAVFLPAAVFLSMEKCAANFVTESCAMCGSVLASLVGLVGSAYCFVVSAIALLRGPYCFTELGWSYPFEDQSGSYLVNRDNWARCMYPTNIVEWDVTLLSILLGLSVLEFIILFLQLVNGVVNAVCRPCCYKQEYSLNA